MRTRGSQKDLQSPAPQELFADNPPELQSWQPKILSIHGPWHNCSLVDSAADVYVCNNLTIMTDYYEQLTNVGGSTSESIFQGQGKVQLRLSQKDGSEGVIFNLSDVYFLPHSPCNLVSLRKLNSNYIFYDNENETLYHVKTRKILAYAQR